MNQKLKDAKELLKIAHNTKQEDIFYLALQKIFEVKNESPEDLDPLIHALFPGLLAPIARAANKKLGKNFFDVRDELIDFDMDDGEIEKAS